MDYEYIYTFIFNSVLTGEDAIGLCHCEMNERSIRGICFETPKGIRVITKGSTRRKVERLMNELDGRHLRILDDYTYLIMNDYIKAIRSEYKI